MIPTSTAPARPISWPFVMVLFAGAFLLRLALVLWLDPLPPVPNPPARPHSDDDIEFNQLAHSVAQGEGFLDHRGRATSFRAPGFPIFLAGVYTIFGVNYFLGHVIFCLLGAANSILAYFLAREFLRENGARAVGILSALYLGHLTVSLAFISETIFIPVFTLGCWLFVRFLRYGNWGLLGLAGLLLGFATLTRPFSLLLLPLWGLLLCWLYRKQPTRLVGAGLTYGLPFLLMILPWTARNYHVHGHLVLMTTNGGSTFYGANNDVVWSRPRLWGYWVETNILAGRDQIEAAPNEYEHDRVEWELGKQWVRDNPGKALILSFLKVASLWGRPPEFEVNGNLMYPLRILAYWPLLALMGVGFWRCLRDRDLWRPEWISLHLTILATIVTAMIFCGLARFRDANVSLMMIYAVLGWDGLRSRVRKIGISVSPMPEDQNSQAPMTSRDNPNCPGQN